MTPDEILEYCLNKLEGTVLINSWAKEVYSIILTTS